MRVAVFLVVVFGFAHAAGPGGAADFRLEFYADIRGLAEKGEFDEAERLVESAFHTASDAPHSDRIALLDTLAELQIASGKFSDAGETYWNKAAILTRTSGAEFPDLGAVYVASGRAYVRAGFAQRAVEAFEAALQVDRRYLKCDGDALAELYRDLAQAYGAAGQSDAAERANKLASDSETRCTL